MTKDIDKIKNNKVTKLLAVSKFAVLIIILVGIPLYIYFFHRDVLSTFSSLENVKEYFRAHDDLMIFIYLAAQATQIVICFIPGQWLQIAAGYFWGVGLAFVFSLIGALLGSVITYYLAKLLGHDFIYLILGEEKVKDIEHKLNSKRAVIIVFLIFLIPGVPKDLCNYAAGLSEMKLKPFLIVSLIGRSPGMLGSIIIGQQLGVGGYWVAIGVGVVAAILFVICIIKRKQINGFLDKLYDKYLGENENTN